MPHGHSSALDAALKAMFIGMRIRIVATSFANPSIGAKSRSRSLRGFKQHGAPRGDFAFLDSGNPATNRQLPLQQLESQMESTWSGGVGRAYSFALVTFAGIASSLQAATIILEDGGNLSAVIAAAGSGDTVEIRSNETFVGEIYSDNDAAAKSRLI
jgi:hypothetical protein